MTPDQYDAWYRTPRGNWIGTTEFALLARLLELRPGETVLDAGCGTGYFTRHFAEGRSGWVAGIDRDQAAVSYARRHSTGNAAFVGADAQRLPFPDHSFDTVISVTALCFMQDERAALMEMLRVARRRIVLGLLNRQSLLYLSKGRGGGSGSYRGARWHSYANILELFNGLAVSNLRLHSAVFLPGGGALARRAEPCLAHWFGGYGAFIAASADIPTCYVP
ncbi:MAG: class I SAM-dependent methyltransferase [Betaproteobacteria bacterium]|nr:class I SAM-dependent methyltransferase [Betaproteobacteria bacterium]